MGSSTVEFAMAVPLLFLLTFGLMDFGRLFYTQMTLQHALQQAGRFATMGTHLPDVCSRVDSIRAVAQQAAMGLNVSAIVISSASGSSTNQDPETAKFSAGKPGERVTVSLTCNVAPITPFVGRIFSNGVYVCKVSTTFKNEPFPPSQTTGGCL